MKKDSDSLNYLDVTLVVVVVLTEYKYICTVQLKADDDEMVRRVGRVFQFVVL